MVDHIDRLGEEGPHAGQGGSVTQRCGQMGFAEAVAGDEHQPFLFFEKSELQGFEDLALGDERGMIPIEGVERFNLWEFGGGQARFDLSVELGGNLVGQEAFQEFLVGHIIFSRLGDKPRMIQEAGG